MTGTGPKTGAPLGEDDLLAFVDGRLDHARQAEVEAYLATHPDLHARIAADLELRATLREQLAPIHGEPIPARLRLANVRAAAAARRASSWRTGSWRVDSWRALAAGLALLVLGAGGGFLLGRTAPSPARPAATATTAVAEAANAAYRTFVVEVAHPVEVDAAHEAHLLGWLSKRLGRPLMAPDLSGFGYRLMGGRLLPGEEGAAAQLMYENAGGQRLTLYVAARNGGETAFRFLGSADASTFAWIDQGYGFAVTGPGGREAMLPIAEVVYRVFEAAPANPQRG